MNKAADFVIKKPKLIVIISLLLLIPTALSYFFTDVNYDILSYLPESLDSVKGERILSENFDAGTFTVVIADNTLPTKKKIKLKEEISQVENVSNVFWADDIIDVSVPADILPDSIKDVFYSKNGNYTMMFVLFSDCSSKDRLQAVYDIKEATDGQCKLSGLTPISADTRELSNKELPVYIAAGVILALIVMFVTMESVFLPFIIALVLCMAVVYNMGTNLFLGSVSYITQCIAAILQLGVTMDYSIFLVNRYSEEKQRGGTKEDAMKRAINASLTSLAGSSLTTVFGFLALCFMQLSLGFNIGIVMAKGVISGVASVLFILPAFLLVFDKPIFKYKHRRFIPDFSKLADFSLKHGKKLVAVFLVVLIPALLLAASVNKYYNLTQTLPKELDSISALDTMKKEFNMTTTHFIVVDDSIPADKLVDMETRLQKVDGIENVIAYNLFVGTSVPDSIIPDGITQTIKQGGYQIMLANSVYDAATDESNAQVEQMNKIVKEYGSNNYITGEGAMYNDMVGITSSDFTVTSIVSILAIFILIAFIFKSVSIPAILIASIELAILINEGISALFGVSIPFIAPTIISCVQLGATVDYAILLTSRFREEISAGYDKFTAIRRAASESMRSIFQSSMIFFVVTIGVYFISSMEIVREICAMLARGSVISAVVILFFLTPVLFTLESFISKTSRNWKMNVKNPFAAGAETVIDNDISEQETTVTEFSFSDDDE